MGSDTDVMSKAQKFYQNINGVRLIPITLYKMFQMCAKDRHATGNGSSPRETRQRIQIREITANRRRRRQRQLRQERVQPKEMVDGARLVRQR